MVMAENEGSVNDVVVLPESIGPKSPWNKRSTVLEGSDEKSSPAMGVKSWPDLSDAQRLKQRSSSATDEVTPISTVPPPVVSPNVQGSTGRPRSLASGSPVTSHKHAPRRHPKSNFKRNPNGVPPPPVPLFNQPPIPPNFYTRVPAPHISVSGYAYPPFPGPFPSVKTHLARPGGEQPMQAFVPPIRGFNSDRNFQPSQRGDPNAFPSNISNRRPAMSMQNPSAHPNYAWHLQRPISSGDSVPMQYNMGPRVFGRTPYYAPAPGFIVGPHIPGTAPIYYLPAAPRGSFPVPHPQHFVSHPLNHGIPSLPPEMLVLRTNIVKQIEYYFSDQNLQNDEYLISAMDEEGWVPISTIADFKRVKGMSTDIPFILDALKSSDKIEVQADKIRKFDGWKKWIPVCAKHSLSSEAQSKSNDDLPAHHAPNALKNSELDEDSTKANYKSTGRCSSNDVCEQWTPASVEHTLSSEAQSTGDSHNATLVPKKSELDEDNTNASFEGTVECSSYNEIMENTTIRLNIVAPFSRQNITSDKRWPTFSKDSDQTEVNFSSEFTLQKQCDFSDDTFLLDEELELEQKSVNDNNIPSHIRIEDEDDEIVVNDHDVQRLIIVTQNGGTNGGSRTVNKESQSISSEHASVINDGLYFYEQELKTKKSNRRKNKSSVDNRDANSRSSSTTAGLSLIEPGESSSAGGNIQESGTAHSRRKQKKRFQKQESSHMQRFFTNNYKIHGTGRSSLGAVSESPPSNSVGFFFGSTPPENHGPRYTSVSISPRATRNLSGTSPPVGSLPRSFQSFQHPSHQLLEENGFKQQKYMKYLKRCLSDRKKSGIGCSEEMNTLYRFWSYFLREIYVPPMYEDFCKYALEDAAANYNYGVECLFRFYSYGLEKEFRENLYDDFEQFTLDFYKKGNLYGLEKYWAFHHYGNQHVPHKKHLELEKLLREDYRCLDDFHRANKEKATTSKEINH